jgi:hypothetical protein
MAHAIFYMGVGDSGVGLYARLLRRVGRTLGDEPDIAMVRPEGTDSDNGIDLVDLGSDGAAEEAEAAERAVEDGDADARLIARVPDDAIGALVAQAFGAAKVHPIDARPEADELLAPTQKAFAEGLGELLARQRGSAEVVTVHHPCLAQFAPACMAAAALAGIEARFVLYIRRPAATIDPHGWWYGDNYPLSHRLAGWVNTMAALERHTRQERRVVICHEAVLHDWIDQLAKTATTLGIPLLRSAEPLQLAQVNHAVASELSVIVPGELDRSHVRLASLDLAPDLVGLGLRLDEGLRRLAAEPDWPDVALLDRLRQDAATAYQRALAWTTSSTQLELEEIEVVLSEPRPSRLPHGVRRLIPAPVRRLAH